MRPLFREYGLSLVLATFFLLSWLVQSVAGWIQFASEQMTHGETPELWGESGYVWHWLEATFENWQSEFLQLFTFVVLTTFLIHRNSHESRDGQDRMQQQVEQILEKVESLEQQARKADR